AARSGDGGSRLLAFPVRTREHPSSQLDDETTEPQTACLDMGAHLDQVSRLTATLTGTPPTVADQRRNLTGFPCVVALLCYVRWTVPCPSADDRRPVVARR